MKQRPSIDFRLVLATFKQSVYYFLDLDVENIASI